MKIEHLEVLVEEPSMEVFLAALLPRLVGNNVTFTIHAHQGKSDLLQKLAPKLRAYAKWLPDSTRIIVVIDRDNDDCKKLKHRMDSDARSAGFQIRKSSGTGSWRVVNRIAVEELEAWYFGEWRAVREAYPRASSTVPNHSSYRQPDAITGETWEALERILRRAGYFESGLRKVEAAQAIGKHLNPKINTSPSFISFREAIIDAVA
jgi:Domain of unknown function (DUF4276)